MDGFGLDAKHIGDHSSQNGAANYVNSDSTYVPPQASTHFWVRWTMGHDTHLQFQSAGDQYVGLFFSGL